MFRPVIVPPSTASVLVFPFHSAAKKFDTTFYTPAMTNNRLSLDDINRFIHKLEAARKPITQKQNGLIWWFSLVVFLSMGTIIAFDLKIGIQRPNLIPLFTVGVVCLCLGIGVLLIMSAKSLGKKAKSRCQHIIDQHYHEYQSKGLSWYIPEHYPRWIELHKEYNKDSIKIQTNYIPPDPQ